MNQGRKRGTVKHFVLALSIYGGALVGVGSAATYSDVVLSGNPLFYWNFDEAGDTDAALDLVGTDVGDNLTAQGNATRVAGTSTTGGLFLGRAASFDGVNPTKFASNTLSPPTNPDAWAIEFWVRPEGPDPGTRFQYLLAGKGTAGGNRPAILWDYGSDNKVEVFGGGSRTDAGGPTLLDETWQHLVIGSFGAANHRVDFYLNGAAAGSVAYSGTIAFQTDSITVGASDIADNFKGQMDEVAVYDYTGLSVADISTKLGALATHYSVSQPGIPGDANKDGAVNSLDFNLISQNLFTAQTPGNGGDLDLNAFVDFADFRIWKNAPGGGGAGFDLAVPEPSAMVSLFATLIIGTLTIRRCKSRQLTW